MNRLRVGDECYFRVDGEILKGNVVSLTLKIKKHILVKDSNGYGWVVSRIIYPFPCVKELAV